MAGRWTTSAALLLMLTGAIGCGGDAGGASDGDGSGTEAAIAQTLLSVQRGLAARDGEAVCGALTATGSYELGRLRGGGPGSCARMVGEIGVREHENWKPKAYEIVSVKLNGARASALLRVAGGEPYRVPFARDKSGAWRLTSLVLLDVEAVDNPPYGPTRPYVEPPRKIPEEDLYDVQGDFARDRGESVCDDLTPAGRRELKPYGPPGESCPDTVRRIKDRLMLGGYQLPFSRLLSVSIDGGRATLLVKDPGRPPYRVPVVIGPGDWKLPSLRYAEPIELVRP